MARIEKAMKLLASLEHSGRESKCLHKNKGENGLTYWGIYQSMHPNWKGWAIVHSCLTFNNGNIKKASIELFNNERLYEYVLDFYKQEFWDKMKLTFVNSQKIADEMFCFGVVVSWKISVMKAQKLLGFKDKYIDGLVGNMTLGALNKFDEHTFDISFDEYEVQYFKAVVKAKPWLAFNYNGWVNRAYAV